MSSVTFVRLTNVTAILSIFFFHLPTSSTTIFFCFHFLIWILISFLVLFFLFFSISVGSYFLFFSSSLYQCFAKMETRKKKVYKNIFLILNIFFFISNISFCKLLYHQIGGIGFDIFFSYFLSLCVLCDDVRSGAFLCNFNALFFPTGWPKAKAFYQLCWNTL